MSVHSAENLILGYPVGVDVRVHIDHVDSLGWPDPVPITGQVSLPKSLAAAGSRDNKTAIDLHLNLISPSKATGTISHHCHHPTASSAAIAGSGLAAVSHVNYRTLSPLNWLGLPGPSVRDPTPTPDPPSLGTQNALGDSEMC